MGVLKAKVAGSWVEIPGVGAGAVDVPWIAVTFENGWANRGGTDQACQYRKIGDIVYLRGTMTKTSGLVYGQSAFTLPVGYRTSSIVRFSPAVMDAGAVTQLARGDFNGGAYAPQAGPAAVGWWSVDLQFSVTP